MPAVRVCLVDNDVAQLLEELEPLRVMGQDRGMEHVRVGDHDLPGRADGRANRRRRITVVDSRRDLDLGSRGQLPEAGQLVLAERLRREEVERAGGRILCHGLKHRQVVAQRLARRGGCDHHDVVSASESRQRVRLMAVEHLDAARVERPNESSVEPVGAWRDVRSALGQHAMCDEGVGDVVVLEELLERGQHPGRLVKAHRKSPK